jgi:hypothetical protein
MEAVQRVNQGSKRRDFQIPEALLNELLNECCFKSSEFIFADDLPIVEV